MTEATKLLSHIYNACDPLAPATPEYYVNCAEARGSSAFTLQFKQQLARVESGNFLQCLFSGHIGCGKSSELKRLEHDLETSSRPYFPVYVSASDYLDENDVVPSDILLAVVAKLAESMRGKAGIDLKPTYFQKRFDELKNTLLSEVGVSEIGIGAGDVKATLQLSKKDPGFRAMVRDKLGRQTSTLLGEINLVLDQARAELRTAATAQNGVYYEDIVLILDQLERIQRVEGWEDGAKSQKHLFIECAPQLKGLNVHVIYTIPLRLVRSHGPELGKIYRSAPFVLPMIKIFERGAKRKPYASGIDCMKDLVRRRLGGASLEDVFGPGALDWLITYSGGHVRDLMTFIREASAYTDHLPINLDIAKKALQQTIALYSTSIPNGFWPKLVELELSTDQHIDNNDPDYQTMLEQVYVMEYINGDDDSDPFMSAAPWYAVNPIVRELRQFKDALHVAKKQ